MIAVLRSFRRGGATKIGLSATAAVLLSLLSAAHPCQAQEGASASAASPGSEPQLLAQRVDALRVKYELRTVWFRVEIPGRIPLQVATSGDPGEVLPVASISKSVTAIGIALLIQQGKLRLDSTLGDVLSTYFTQRGETMDDSLKPVTVERLLTHRAGLRANHATDPEHGIGTDKLINKVGGSREFWRYIFAAGEAKSSGSTDFIYSNLSYLILGMVIEAVSGQQYESFCQQSIFSPLGIRDAQIPKSWTLVSPFSGWQLSLQDVLKVWEVFDRSSPTLLSGETLDRTLLGHLGKPHGDNADLYYSLGVNVREPKPGAPYVINHNGIADFMQREPKSYTFVEKQVPGSAWVVVMHADRREVDAKKRREINSDLRALVRELANGG